MTGFTPEEDIPGDFTSQISGQLQSPVATGSFGDIYRCSIVSNEGNTDVAVKVFKIDRGRTIEKLQKVILRELDVWLRLKHSTIVPLLGTARVDSPLLALVSQWMPSGTLAEYLDERVMIITPSARIGLAKGIADGLDYLHSENVVHGDLHPANVLIDGSGNPCLADFGLATVAENPNLQWNTTTVGRILDSRWRAPEVLGIDGDPERPTFKSDIYSCGSVMFFIISGDIPWKEKKHSHQICIELSKRTTPPRPNNIFDNQWDLIQQCWTWDPEHRPAATIVGERAEVLIRRYEKVYPLTITPERDASDLSNCASPTIVPTDLDYDYSTRRMSGSAVSAADADSSVAPRQERPLSPSSSPQAHSPRPTEQPSWDFDSPPQNTKTVETGLNTSNVQLPSIFTTFEDPFRRSSLPAISSESRSRYRPAPYPPTIPRRPSQTSSNLGSYHFPPPSDTSVFSDRPSARPRLTAGAHLNYYTDSPSYLSTTISSTTPSSSHFSSSGFISSLAPDIRSQGNPTSAYVESDSWSDFPSGIVHPSLASQLPDGINKYGDGVKHSSFSATPPQMYSATPRLPVQQGRRLYATSALSRECWNFSNQDYPYLSNNAFLNTANSPIPSSAPVTASSPTLRSPPHAALSTLVDRPMRKRGKLPKETTDYLKAWLHRHSDHPYPSEDEKKQLSNATGLSMSQVTNWMINARRRILAGPAARVTACRLCGGGSDLDYPHNMLGLSSYNIGHSHHSGSGGQSDYLPSGVRKSAPPSLPSNPFAPHNVHSQTSLYSTQHHHSSLSPGFNASPSQSSVRLPSTQQTRSRTPIIMMGNCILL